MQSGQRADPHARVGQARSPPSRRGRCSPRATAPARSVRQHLRMPTVACAVLRRQRVGRHRRLHVPQQSPIAVRLWSAAAATSSSCPQLVVDTADGALVQVEALQAGRRDLQRGRSRTAASEASATAVRTASAPSPPPRPCTDADPAAGRRCGQPLADPPPQMIYEEIRVRLLRTPPLVGPQEAVRLLIHGPVRPKDRVRPATASPLHGLHPKVPKDHPSPHPPPSTPRDEEAFHAR